MRSPAQSAFNITFGCLLLLATGAIFASGGGAQVGERRNKVMAQVDIGSGGGGSSDVTFSLYRVQAGCCAPCKVPPRRPCRMCCPLLRSDPDYSITLSGSGTLKFENIDPGTYLLLNKADGGLAGLEQVLQVEENSNVNLGKIEVEVRRPRGAAGDRLPPREP